jgi:hypothetical protein
MPSLHRPDLVNYFVRNLSLKSWTELQPRLRRRIILRPESADHYDYTQESVIDPMAVDGWNPGEPFTDLNRNGQWDPGEPFSDRPPANKIYDTGDRTFAATAFDAVNGPWDVDSDGDGETDSIWVDLGMPVTTLADGRAVKPLFAILCTDLDGRLNVNAHGSPAQYMRITVPPEPLQARSLSGLAQGSTEERILLGAAGYFFKQTINGAFTATGQGTKQALDGQNMNLFNMGATKEDAYAFTYAGDEPQLYTDSAFSMQPAVGQGWSVADVNLGAHFVRYWYMLPSFQLAGVANPNSYPPLNHYRHLLEGSYWAGKGANISASQAPNNPNGNIWQGRYGEIYLLRPHFPLGGATAQQHYPGTMSVPRAGISDNLRQPITTTTIKAYVPNALLYDPADDDFPGAPSPVRNGGGNAMTVRGNSTHDSWLDPYGQANTRFGVYATPGDPDANGFIGLDLAGRPIFKQMGTTGETRDEPWEINLTKGRYSPRASTLIRDNLTGKEPAGAPADIDGNFSPGEMARILRDADPDVGIYEPRLRQMMDYDNSPRTNPLAHSITSEQWDIPCPHIAPTPEMALALRYLGLPVNNPSLGDLLKARFYLAYGGQTNSSNPINAALAAKLSTISMRSYRIWSQGTDPSNPGTEFV